MQVLQILFPSNYGSSYVLRRSVDLQASSWESLVSEVEGTGGVMSVRDPNPEPLAFYRLKETRPKVPIDYDKFEAIARSGDSPSGTERAYQSFRLPTINFGGEMAFVALTNPQQTIGVFHYELYELFFRSPAGQVSGRLMAGEGANIGTFKTINLETLENAGPFAISDTGGIAATGDFFVNEAGLSRPEKMRIGPEGIDTIIFQGEIVREGDPDQFYWENEGLFSLPMRINDSGKFAFAGVYRNDGAATSAGSGIHTDEGIVVRDGDPIPGLGETFSAVSSPVINDADEIAFSGRRVLGDAVDNSNDGVFIVQDDGVFTTWLTEGALAPGYPTSETKETRFLSSSPGGLPFLVSCHVGSACVLVVVEGLSVVARQGEAADEGNAESQSADGMSTMHECAFLMEKPKCWRFRLRGVPQ